MAFLLEDGTGLAGANAYTSVAAVLTYLTDRGRETENSWSTLTSAQQEEYIVRATDYIEKVFNQRWKGWMNSNTQGLTWPRYNALGKEGWHYESDEVPAALAQATAEYAVRAAGLATSELMPDPTTDATGRVVVEKQLGPLRKKFAENASTRVIKRYPAADRLLRDLVHPGGGVIR